eukprot:3343220-Prymnesium_polylepis.1
MARASLVQGGACRVPRARWFGPNGSRSTTLRRPPARMLLPAVKMVWPCEKGPGPGANRRAHSSGGHA